MPKHQGCGFESDETHLECQLQGECVTYTFFIKMFSTFPYCFNGSWSWLYSMIRWLVESCGVIDEPEPIWPKPTGSDGTLCTLLYRRLFSLSLLISPPSYKGDAILDISFVVVKGTVSREVLVSTIYSNNHLGSLIFDQKNIVRQDF